jgi:hypothetical protein
MAVTQYHVYVEHICKHYKAILVIALILIFCINSCYRCGELCLDGHDVYSCYHVPRQEVTNKRRKMFSVPYKVEYMFIYHF